MTDLYRQGYLQALEDLKAQILPRWERMRGLLELDNYDEARLLELDNYDEARMDTLGDTLCRIAKLRASLGDGPAPQEEAKPFDPLPVLREMEVRNNDERVALCLGIEAIERERQCKSPSPGESSERK